VDLLKEYSLERLEGDLDLLEGKLLLLKAEQVELLENRFLFHSATILSMYHPVNTHRAQQN
jgi:hypothetical protein